MFNSKLKQLYESEVTSVKNPDMVTGENSGTMVSSNPFILDGLKKGARIEGGRKLSTSGSNFLDQFASTSKYLHPRSFEDISADMSTLWAQNPELTLQFTLYLRMITRKVSFPNGHVTKDVQKGQGLKNEGIMRMLWLAIYYPQTFAKNINLFISVGSWKDIITMLSLDLQYHGWRDKKLDWNMLGQVILAGLENPATSELLKKYLPTIRTKKKASVTIEAQAKTLIGKWICSLLFGNKYNEASTYKRYRLLKSSGTAHQWQQLISQNNLIAIDFNTIHGRALSQLVSGKFLRNHNLENLYEKWIAAQPVAKFTGYPYELINGHPRPSQIAALKDYQKSTINKQFEGLVEKAKMKNVSSAIRPISVIDVSGSMFSKMRIGENKTGDMESIQVAFTSAIFFNEMMDKKSPFRDVYFEFNDRSQMCKFRGDTFLDKYMNSVHEAYGSTDFLQIVKWIARYHKEHPEVSEQLLPNFLVAFSDGEFNTGNIRNGVTTFEQIPIILRNAGFTKEYIDSFGVCLVDLPNSWSYRTYSTKFETFANAPNCFYFSGYDLSPLSFLFELDVEKKNSIPRTAEELFLAAMDQEALNLAEV